MHQTIIKQTFFHYLYLIHNNIDDFKINRYLILISINSEFPSSACVPCTWPSFLFMSKHALWTWPAVRLIWHSAFCNSPFHFYSRWLDKEWPGLCLEGRESCSAGWKFVITWGLQIGGFWESVLWCYYCYRSVGILDFTYQIKCSCLAIFSGLLPSF